MLVFIDEIWTKTSMVPLRGWAQRRQRIKAKVPHGRGQTMTRLAALRHDRVTAPWLIDGPINGATFQLYVEKVLVPTLRPGDIVIMDNLGLHKGQGCPPRHSRGRRPAILPAKILSRLEPDRAVLRQVQALASQSRTTNHRDRPRCDRPNPRHRYIN